MEKESSTHANNGFTASQALELVSAYFDTEWPQTNLKDVQLRQITGGFVNRLHLITRSTAVTKEPRAVLIRHFGLGKTEELYEEPRASNTSLSATEQALVYYEMGRRRWGPKIYGVFPGGRLEEYIDAHPLTAVEAGHPSIRKDVARSYARLHSLKLPLRKTFPHMVNELKEAGGTKKDRTIGSLLQYGHRDAERLAVVLRDMDLQHEVGWVAGLFTKYRCKPAIAVGDTNFLNVLVKNYDSECRAMLIDYETCTYSYRGVDIGGHFTERMYCWSHPESNFTGYPAPDVEEQRSFCKSYIEEMKVLGLKMTAEDSEEHLLLEAQIVRFFIAKSFAETGVSRIVILSRSPGPQQEANLALASSFPNLKVIPYQVSITDYARVSSILKEVGTIDVLVLSATTTGPGFGGSNLNISVDDMQIIFDTNVIAAFNLVQTYLGRPQPSGGRKTIINVSSLAAHMVLPGQVGYGPSKAAVTQIFNHFAKELDPAKVALLSYHPGALYTAKAASYDIKDKFDWDDIELPGHFAVWLASPEASLFHGRMVWSNWDAGELLASKEKLEKDFTFLTIGLLQ